jgi:RecB family endonuclease NucS
MAKGIKTAQVKKLLKRRGVSFVKLNHPEAVQHLKRTNDWEDIKNDYTN